MSSEHVKSATDKAATDKAATDKAATDKAATDKAKGANKDPGGKAARNGTEVNFDKPLGSSHDDQADLRDVARKAAKKSQ